MGTRDAIRLLRQYGVFPRRKRRWQPTEQWRAAMLENLSRAPRRRSPEETWQIKQAVRDWLALPEAQRPTQQALADTWGVSKQRINRLVHQLPPSDPFDQADRIPEQLPGAAPLRSPVSHAPQAVAPQTGPAPPPARLKVIADAHDAAILEFIGYNPNRSKGWFDDW